MAKSKPTPILTDVPADVIEAVVGSQYADTYSTTGPSSGEIKAPLSTALLAKCIRGHNFKSGSYKYTYEFGDSGALTWTRFYMLTPQGVAATTPGGTGAAATLYGGTGQNTDGAMTQKATTDALGGKADLVGGTVPASQLPSYVDDILEFSSVATLPATGEKGKLYVITDSVDKDKVYRWSGSQYVFISGPDAKKVNAAMVIAADGTVATYDGIDLGIANVQAGQTLALRGVALADVNLPRNIELDATGFQLGQKTMLLGPFTGGAAGSTVYNAVLVGFNSQGRVVVSCQSSVAAGKVVFRGATVDKGGHFEIFALNTAAQGVIDTIELVDCKGYKDAAHSTSVTAGNLDKALVTFQSRTDFGQRVVKLICRGETELINLIGPVFGGYAAAGTTIELRDTTRVVPGSGFAVQTVQNINTSTTAYTDADILRDYRKVRPDGIVFPSDNGKSYVASMVGNNSFKFIEVL